MDQPDTARSSAPVVRPATPDDRLPIQRMLELYQYDLSDIWPSDIDSHGEYGYPLDRYWSDAWCHPFVATVAGRYAGFALVDDAVRIGESGRWMDQFFVMKKYRRDGVGGAMARQVFSELRGQWEVGQMLKNYAAQAFWRRVIGEFTDGRFVEVERNGDGWQGIVQRFDSSLFA